MDANEMLAAERQKIDMIDRQLVPLFEKRMAVAAEIAAIKRENNLSVFDEAREQAVIDRVAAEAAENLRGEVSLLMRTIMALSRERQRRVLFKSEAPLPPPPVAAKTDGVVCAYQGVPGAWSEEALAQVFPEAEKLAVDYFEDVFTAVKAGKADYGVVPIENSQTGAIGETYDLLRKYGCYIVGRVWVSIKQCLMAKPGVELNDITTVYSHPEGFKQCRGLLQKHGWAETACTNTAVAAKAAADDKSGHAAAIGSKRAAQLNGLALLAEDIADSKTNRTSFVVIGKAPEYTAASDMTTVTFATAHRSGALCETLLPFMAAGIDLARIESRPAGAGEYRFFADVQCNVMDETAAEALRQAAAASAYFEVVGCYSVV